jgi:hypothetical protein
VPFGDVKPLKVVAFDAANMAGCAIANKILGCFRTAANAGRQCGVGADSASLLPCE